MTASSFTDNLDAVLDLFMMEDDHGSDTLKRYVETYPQYARSLIDFSRLIATPDEAGDTPLSAADHSRIDAAWVIHNAAPPPPAADPFASLTTAKAKAIANSTGIPRQVVLAFPERRVLSGSVPRWTIRAFSEQLDVPPPHIIAALDQPGIMSASRSFKSDGKPAAGEKVTFEQLLIDAGVSAADRARLLSDD